LAERVLKTVTKSREVVISGRLSISKYTKQINGVKVEMKVPVVKLSSFHLCGPKPKSEEVSEVKPTATRKRKAA
jgi:single-stranded DNA-binding protein